MIGYGKYKSQLNLSEVPTLLPELSFREVIAMAIIINSIYIKFLILIIV